MTLRLIRVRECDGACCKESPRFPAKGGSDCIYRDANGCQIKRGEAAVPAEKSADFNRRFTAYASPADLFKRTCEDWPANMPGRNTGGCCWQWVDD